MVLEQFAGDDWSKIIIPSIVPVVIISAVGLVSQTIYSRIAMVISRFREFEKERLIHHKELSGLAHEKKMPELQEDLRYFIQTIEMQSNEYAKRFKLLKKCQFCLLISMGAFVLSSFSIGIHVLFYGLSAWILIFFMLGMFLFLIALYYSLRELHVSGRGALKEGDALDRMFKARYPH